MQLNKIFLMLALGALTLIGGCAQPRASSPASGQASGSASTAESPMRTVAGGASGESQATNRTTQKVDDRAGDPNRYRSPPGYPACRYFDGFKDNGDGTVTDPRDGLIWKRCAEGQTWTGQTCAGIGVLTSYLDAVQLAKSNRFLGKSDWRIPTIDELSMVVGGGDHCRHAGDRNIKIGSSEIVFPMNYAGAGYASAFLGSFWSASRLTTDAIKDSCDYILRTESIYKNFEQCARENTWLYRRIKDFSRGYSSSTQTTNRQFTRLVRGGQKLGQEVFDGEVKAAGKEKNLADNKVSEWKRADEEKRMATQRKIDERIKAGCSRYYVGKAVQFKPAGLAYLGQKLNAIVLGFGSGKVTLQIKDSVDYNRIFEAPCTSDQVFTD